MKLAAFDQDDLIVISAHLQDAMVLVSDMTYLGSTQRFVFACDRPLSGDQYMTGVHFERVIRVRVSNLPPRDSKVALKLLGVTFISTASPAGEVVLLFDGDAAIRLSVECLEVAMADFSAVTGQAEGMSLTRSNASSRLASVTLDQASIGRGTPEQEHERTIAIYDLVEANFFAVPGHSLELYTLHISLASNRLVLDVRDVSGFGIVTHVLSLTPFRQIVKDYFLICESYYQAIRSASLSQIEAIDMGRRGLHNEAAELLMARLEGKLAVDFDTARRLFTLVSALRWKG